jgi:hypothetical protein
MTSACQLIRFPARRSRCIWIFPEDGTWIVLHGNHGWLFADFGAAVDEAHWLSENSGLPIRRAAG